MTPEERILAVLGPVVDRAGGGPPGWPLLIQRYLDLLEARNRSVNLISRKTATEALERHVLPCLAALRVVAPGTPTRVLDVGTGAGLPGIPLRILRPSVRLDLVEATRKKCAFLEECVREVSLEDTRVHWCRVEEPSEDLQGRAPFDRVVARAMGNDAVLERAARPLLAAGGEVWVFAPPDAEGALRWEDAQGKALTALKRLI